ncbi:TadE/TadG family type IV pilus assembly protein [Methylobacterium sp. JK268]
MKQVAGRLARPIGRGARLAWTCARGTTSIEFGLVILPLMLTLLVVFETGSAFFMMSALDYAARAGARSVMTGAVSTAGMSATQFRDQVVCPKLPSLFTCANVFVNLTVVPSGQTPTGYNAYVAPGGGGLSQPALTSSGSFCPGAGGQYVVLLIQYPAAFLSGHFAAVGGTTYNGQSVHVLMASTTFRSEPYGGAVTYAGC